MTEQWIPAAAAQQLLSEHNNTGSPSIALCARAHAGLVTARAQLIVVGGQREEQAAIPAKFWWAEGRDALEQDWATGDFSTWIDRTFHWRAFGVAFALDGLLEMLPIERRAAVSRSLSVAGKPDWLKALDARQITAEKAKALINNAETMILDGCILGLVSARAVLMRRADGGRPQDWTADEREWDIPIWYWEAFTNPETSSQDWERGSFSGKGKAPEGMCWISLSGVHFLAESMSRFLPAGGQKVAEQANGPNSGGRPPKDWWDDLWCAVWGQVYRGSLNPKNQAEVERAMLGWAEERDHSVSVSVVRPLARKMFKELVREGGNP